MNALELAHKLAAAREVVDAAIVTNCPVPLVYADKDGRWCLVNTPMEELMAAASSDLLADGWLKFVVAGQKEWEAAIKDRADTTKIYMKFKSADAREVMAYASLTRLTNGGFVSFILPVCGHPAGCPVHGFLLHNVEASGTNVARAQFRKQLHAS